MSLFFDTSALVKLFHQEKGSGAVLMILETDGFDVIVSELARLEFVTAMHRKVRTREITDAQFAEALGGFEESWSTFRVEPIGDGVVYEAETLVRTHGKVLGLRTLDALHLATFALVSESAWQFVVADDALAKVAKTMGFLVLNPMDSLT